MEGLMSLIHNHAIPVSATILLVAYIFIATEKIPKVTVALLGAALTLILGLLGQDNSLTEFLTTVILSILLILMLYSFLFQ